MAWLPCRESDETKVTKMAEKSKIEWTHSTFNPWQGCHEVSPACDHCYARSGARRFGRGDWGKDGLRWFPSEKYWLQPLRWNRQAGEAGQRRRVFCGSMCDVFEKRADLDSQRERLWPLIVATPNLDWLLLTKRPQGILKMVPWKSYWPANVWVGATTEDQYWADKRLPHLLKVPAAVRFLSCEPLLGPINLAPFLGQGQGQIGWLIAGGESGPGARPTALEWVRGLRDQCLASGAQFFHKQWGAWVPTDESSNTPPKRRLVVLGTEMERLSKKAAGRELDGRAWNQLPVVRLP
jgi:protein gp37